MGRLRRPPPISYIFPTGYTLIRTLLALLSVHSSLPERNLSMNRDTNTPPVSNSPTFSRLHG